MQLFNCFLCNGKYKSLILCKKCECEFFILYFEQYSSNHDFLLFGYEYDVWKHCSHLAFWLQFGAFLMIIRNNTQKFNYCFFVQRNQNSLSRRPIRAILDVHVLCEKHPQNSKNSNFSETASIHWQRISRNSKDKRKV